MSEELKERKEPMDSQVSARTNIIPMSVKDVGSIVAGQAISDLASAVKELIDNALDAGATSITIRLFNQGVDVIEICDNGCGVPLPSRALMATKHATSKIRSFQDLYESKTGGDKGLTLGFRGEALFCLANLSQNLVVSTKTIHDSVGQRMHFRKDGSIDPSSITDTHRTVGTTVAVIKLFDALPVRRADFIKRIKAQRAKLLRVLQSYAILCVGVKFHVSDVTGTQPNLKSDTRLTTNEKSASYQDTISAVLGSRFLAGLSPIHINLSSFIQTGAQRASRGVSADDTTVTQTQWRIEGLVSKAPNSVTGEKIAREVQFFCLNGRPVDLPKMSRLFFDAWKLYDCLGNTVIDDSLRKRPACILGIYLPSYMIDVNVSPDKREVFIVDEENLFRVIKEELSLFWSGQKDGIFKMNEASSTINKKRTIEESYPASSCDNVAPDPGSEIVPKHDNREWVRLQQSKLQFNSSRVGDQNDEIMLLDAFSRRQSEAGRHRDDNVQTRLSFKGSANSQQISLSKESLVVGSINEPEADMWIERPTGKDTEASHARSYSVGGVTDPRDQVQDVPKSQISPCSNFIDDSIGSTKGQNTEKIFSFGGTTSAINQYMRARVTMKRMRRQMTTLYGNSDVSVLDSSQFSAESEHQHETIGLSKADFRNMIVVGQYNLGFILAMCPRYHLWILDQHACDERKNFEVLCSTTTIHEQHLMKPLPLELSSSEETCVLENKELFEKNGFRFSHDATKPVRQRLSLTALPHSGSGAFSKAVQFDKDDVSALCALLGAETASSSSGFIAGSGTGANGDGSMGNNAVRRYAAVGGEVVRLPKAVAMFASRACRSSKMIGDALTEKDMYAIVNNLQSVADPWTCPHGRPTMRHVKELLSSLLEDEYHYERRIKGPTLTTMTQIDG